MYVPLVIKEFNYIVNEILFVPRCIMYVFVLDLVKSIENILQNLFHFRVLWNRDKSTTIKLHFNLVICCLGKTTLAKALYDRLQEEFYYSAFVPVGRNPSVKKLLNDILFEIDKQKHQDSILSSWDERQLIDQLRRSLATKRYAPYYSNPVLKREI